MKKAKDRKPASDYRYQDTSRVRFAKKWYPKGTKPGEENINEFLPSNMKSSDRKISGWYGESEREDSERINANDPLKKYTNKQKYVEEFWGRIASNFGTGENKIKEISSAKKIQQTLEMPFKLIKWEEYPCKVVKIDDFGNAMIELKNTEIQGMLYNARKLNLVVWAKREVLFARTNKKGKYIFELPKNPQKIVPDYYDTYAKWISQEDTLKKLFSQYGSKNVKETLKSIIDEKVLEKTWEEYKKAA